MPTVIDSGLKHRVNHLLSFMQKDGIDTREIKLVINTHAHPDHYEGSQIFIDNGAMMTIHQEEDRFLRGLGVRLYRMFGMEVPDFKIDFYLKEGDLELGDNKLQIYHTPGHSPGSISIYWPEKKALITGDLIFDQGVGRTDFPGCDSKLLKENIERLSKLDVEYLLPGHGDIIVGRDKVIQNFDFIKKAIFAYL